MAHYAVSAIKNAGYTDLVDSFSGLGSYSFVFFGEAGYLDHALSSGILTPQVTGAALWHINADEPRALDYNNFNQPALFVDDQFRSSDHDPVLIGLELVPPPDCSTAVPSRDTVWPPNHTFASIDVLGVTDSHTVSITIDAIFQDEPVDNRGDGSFGPDGQGVGTSTAHVRVERAGSGNGRVYHISFTADNGHGGRCSGVVQVGVPKNRGKKGSPIDGGPLYDSTVP